MPIKPNAFIVDGETVRIDVSTKKLPGSWAIIDASDRGMVLDGRGRWFAADVGKGRSIYVIRHAAKKTVYLHRFLLRDCAQLIDHEDGDGLNNRRGNLRPANRMLNQYNSKSHADGSSCYKGVWRRGDNGRWTASISRQGRKYSLGCFEDELEAALAYDRAAISHFGPFARLNMPNAAAIS